METLMESLNRKIRDFFFFIVCFQFFFSNNFFERFLFIFFERKEEQKHVQWKREKVCNLALQLKQKERILVSFQVMSYITSTRIIKKGVLDYFSSSRVLRTILVSIRFIQESENKQENCGIELIKVVKEEECGICTKRSNSKSLPLKLSIINIYCVMIPFVCVCCDYINCSYD